MGFEIMIEIEAGGTSSKVNQFDEDGKLTAFIGNVNVAGTTPAVATGIPSFNAHNVDAYFGDARHAAWWIEHADLGTHDGRSLGERRRARHHRHDRRDIALAASNSFILLNGGFFIRGPTGQVYAMTWASIGDPAV